MVKLVMGGGGGLTISPIVRYKFLTTSPVIMQNPHSLVLIQFQLCLVTLNTPMFSFFGQFSYLCFVCCPHPPQLTLLTSFPLQIPPCFNPFMLLRKYFSPPPLLPPSSSSSLQPSPGAAVGRPPQSAGSAGGRPPINASQRSIWAYPVSRYIVPTVTVFWDHLERERVNKSELLSLDIKGWSDKKLSRSSNAQSTFWLPM